MSGRLTVSLSALAANYRQLCANATGSVAAVVKADGYGLGAPEVAGHLVREGCREFFVATATEGVRLRRHLRETPIYILEGAYPGSVEQLVRDELIPVLNTPDQCRTWAATGRAGAVHVDTGMQRLGLPYASAVDTLAGVPFPISLFISHFARADEQGHASLQQQIDRGRPVYQTLRVMHPEMRLSLCNSAGLLAGLGPEDVGRAGIGLYGGNPLHETLNPMQPVVTMSARVMQIRDVAAGIPIGYSGAYVTPRDSRLAVLAVGYADGLPRLLSDCGHVWLGEQRCPIVGRVSMDLTIVDATGVDVTEGDWAEVIGPHISLDEVAAHAQTLTYEVLTGISRRMARDYEA